MSSEHAVGQQLTQLRVWPTLNNELCDKMQVSAGIDVVGDACAYNRQDLRGTLSSEVEPGKQPVFSTYGRLLDDLFTMHSLFLLFMTILSDISRHDSCRRSQFLGNRR